MRIKEVEEFIESIDVQIDDSLYLATYFEERAALVGEVLELLLEEYDELGELNIIEEHQSEIIKKYSSTEFLRGEEEVTDADVYVMIEVLKEMLEETYIPPFPQKGGLTLMKIHLAVLWAFYGFCRPQINIAVLLRLDVSSQKLTSVAGVLMATISPSVEDAARRMSVVAGKKKQGDRTTGKIFSTYKKLSPEWSDVGGKRPICLGGKQFSVHGFADVIRDQMKKDFHREEVKGQKWVADKLKQLKKDGSI